jgi:drug/metabolite transporter (DMT)-like permease
MTDRNKGILYAFLSVILWATLGTGYKLTISRLDAFSVAIYVGIFTTASLLAYLVMVNKTRRIVTEFKGKMLFFIGAGILGAGIQQICYLKAYEYLPASQVVIIYYLFPLVMVVFSAFIFKEKTTLLSFIFVALGFVGVYVVVAKGTWLRIDLSLGVVLAILTPLFGALFSALLKHKEFDVEVGAFLFNLFGLVFLAALTPWFNIHWDATWRENLGMLFIAIFPSAIGLVIWNRALRLVSTGICSNIILLTPILSVALIFAVLKEPMVVSQLAGMMIIVGSVFLNLRFGEKSKN